MSALEIGRDGAVATVTLGRPERRNALDPALLQELTEAFTGLAEGDDVRVIVLRGAGPAFCAGADLDWMAASLGLPTDLTPAGLLPHFDPAALPREPAVYP